MLVTGRNFFDIECWWLRHNEESNVLIVCNKGRHGLLKLGISIWCLSGNHFSTNLYRLRTDSSREVILDALPQWNERPKHDAVAIIELKQGSKTFCFKNIGGKLIPTTYRLDNVVHSFPVWQEALS